MTSPKFYQELMVPDEYNNIDTLVEDYWDNVEKEEVGNGIAYKATDPSTGDAYLLEIRITGFSEHPLDEEEQDAPLSELLD